MSPGGESGALATLRAALDRLADGAGDDAWRALADAPVDDQLGRLVAAIDGALKRARAAPPPDAALGRACFDYALNGILETGAGLRIVQANPAAASITGLSRTELRRMVLPDLFDGGPGQPAVRHCALVREQGISRGELALRGAGRLLEIASVDVGGGRMLHVFDDITEQRQLALATQRACHAAEEANQAKSRFLTNISHEIRTPLNGVIGLSQLALMTPLTAQQKDYLHNIAHSSRLLLAMLNDLLDFSKIEAGRVEFEQIPFSLDEVVDELAPAAAQAARGKPLELVFQIGPEVPRHLVGDRLRLGQVLTNLLGNAIKFTAAGRVALNVSCAPQPQAEAGTCLLRFSVWDTGIGIAAAELERLFTPFSQADVSITRRFGGTGLGLAITKMLIEGLRGRIEIVSSPGEGSEFIAYLPFDADPQPAPAVIDSGRRALVVGARAHTRSALRQMLEAEGYAARASASAPGAADADARALLVVDCADLPAPGTALPALLGAHAGLLALIDLDTHERIGPRLAEAGVELLIKPVTPESLRRALYRLRGRAAPAVAALQAPREFAGASLLVAEDNAINQQVIGDLLRYAGIAVRIVADGAEALAALRHGAAPDLILMDVQMPGMDGLAATRALRAAGHRLPVIGLSAGVSREERQACSEAGMSDFLPKPIDVDELWGALTRWLPARPRALAPVAPVAPAAAVPAAGFPGIDLADALPRFLNRSDSLRQSLDRFIAERRGALDQLQCLCQAGDWDALARRLHALKGAAGLLGARDVAAAAVRLERCVSAREPAGLASALGALRVALGALG